MLSRQPSQQWRDEARRTQRERAARGSQVGWRPDTNLQRGDPRVRARDGTQGGPLLQAPNMPGFNNGPAARRSNVPIVCCGMLMERDSPQFRLVKFLVAIDVVLITIYMLVIHDSADDGLTLPGYALGLALTMCFGPLLICSPFIVAACCKCWYDRKIEAAIQNQLMVGNGEVAAEAEAARLERIRAEMASTVMSGLQDQRPMADEEASDYEGQAIVQGELFGDIILLDKISAANPVSAVPATPVRSVPTELMTAVVPGSPAAGDSPSHHSLEFSSGSRGQSMRVVGPAIATGRVVQPGDWRLSNQAVAL